MWSMHAVMNFLRYSVDVLKQRAVARARGSCRLFELEVCWVPSAMLRPVVLRVCMFGCLCVVASLRANGCSDLVLVILRSHRSVARLMFAHARTGSFVQLRAAHVEL